MNVKVLMLGKKLFDGRAVKVIVPSVNGEMCLLPHHISIITQLQAGSIKVFRPDSDKPFSVDIAGGVCSFFNGTANFILE